MKRVILCFLAGVVGLVSGWAAPVITSQPQSQGVVAGSEAVFSVEAEGEAGLTYQWLFNGVAIFGANGSTLRIENVQPEDAGSYMVVVADNKGETVSNAAQLSLAKPLVTGIERAVRVYFPTETGKSYQVLVSDGLGEWEPTGELVKGNGSEMEVFYVASGKRFFRVEELEDGGPPVEGEFENMVWIQPGTFTMGSPSNEEDRDTNEGPQTKVTISRGFWMSKYEVTQTQYTAVMGSNPSWFKGDNIPVNNVTWHDAVDYCAKLTLMEKTAGRLPGGYEYRLPTEAEWEYACRAGTTTRFSFGNDENQLGEYAWYFGNSFDTTHPVGQKKPNGWGLYDMHGNVLEWCLDLWGDYPGGSVTDPQGPATGSYRVLRGGNWYYYARYCRSADRYISGRPGSRRSLGFRPVLAPGL